MDSGRLLDDTRYCERGLLESNTLDATLQPRECVIAWHTRLFCSNKVAKKSKFDVVHHTAEAVAGAHSAASNSCLFWVRVVGLAD